jgi:hypothetical protein
MSLAPMMVDGSSVVVSLSIDAVMVAAGVSARQ